jgi:Uma2 family endonuclease
MKTLYKWSVEDYHQMIDSGVLEGKSVELLEGEIIEMSLESPLHINIAIPIKIRTKPKM